jgi:hypothetical protein
MPEPLKIVDQQHQILDSKTMAHFFRRKKLYFLTDPQWLRLFPQQTFEERLGQG